VTCITKCSTGTEHCKIDEPSALSRPRPVSRRDLNSVCFTKVPRTAADLGQLPRGAEQAYSIQRGQRSTSKPTAKRLRGLRDSAQSCCGMFQPLLESTCSPSAGRNEARHAGTVVRHVARGAKALTAGDIKRNGNAGGHYGWPRGHSPQCVQPPATQL
jgi:hypothetical protein